jgi:hypothetical protein
MSEADRNIRSARMRLLATTHPKFLVNQENMKGDTNPSKRLEVRQKISAALSGISRPHLSGGNGAGLTEPQRILLEALSEDWVPEFCVWGKGFEPSWPVMLVDLAFVEKKLVIEVDGPSHNTIKARERDARKDSLLLDNGWRVLRVKNQEILSDLRRVITKVQEFCQSQS